MTYRVLLEAGRMRTSKPGHNVMTAGQLGLQFDSNFANPTKFIKGQFSGNAEYGDSDNVVIPYGKLFSSPPFIQTQVQIGGQVYIICGFNNVNMKIHEPIADPSKTMQLRITVENGQVKYRIGAIFSSHISFTIHYYIFDYRVGL